MTISETEKAIAEGRQLGIAMCAKFVPQRHLVKQEFSELRRVCECGKRRK